MVKIMYEVVIFVPFDAENLRTKIEQWCEGFHVPLFKVTAPMHHEYTILIDKTSTLLVFKKIFRNNISVINNNVINKGETK